MNDKTPEILSRQVEEQFLPFVRRPGRYIGGEVNQVKKDLSKCDVTVALCFPDAYEIAMSHTGLAILYDILNRTDSVAAERAFAPWLDAEQVMREKNIPLFTLESKAALKDFDIAGFSMMSELCYSNVLNMLDLAGIPLRSCNRNEDHPLIIAGGVMANCCEPVAEFIDLFVLGEAEEALVELVELFKAQKKSGAAKRDFLAQAAAKSRWAYVPSLYKFDYAGDKIKSFQSLNNKLPTRFENAVVDDFDNAPVPLAPLIPFAEAVHERVSVEIMRGCPGRCRFCQATFCRRPIRYRSVDKIVELAKNIYHATGFDTVSLLSLSTGEYPELEELVGKLNDYFKDKYVGLSLPSLRVEKQLEIIPKLMTTVRKPGLTIAVESASEKLRRVINKPLADEDLFAGVEAAYEAGFQKVKLYFMIGFPGESEDDIKRIVELSDDLAKLRRKVDGRTAQINAAVNWLVPKPHTPFAWLEQKPKSYFQNAKRIILDEKRRLRAGSVRFKFHNIERSILESATAKAGRRLGDVIESAWKMGARFDLWDDCFDYNIWKSAFEEFGMDIESAAQKSFEPNDILPWEHLGGPKKDLLLSHLNEAMKLANHEE